MKFLKGYGTSKWFFLKKALRDYIKTVTLKTILLFILFFFKFLLVFSYNCLHFLPIPAPHPCQTHLHFWYTKFSSVIISLPSTEIPLAFPLEQVCWRPIILVFFHLRVSLFHVHIWRIFSPVIEFKVDSCFPSTL